MIGNPNIFIYMDNNLKVPHVDYKRHSVYTMCLNYEKAALYGRSVIPFSLQINLFNDIYYTMCTE